MERTGLRFHTNPKRINRFTRVDLAGALRPLFYSVCLQQVYAQLPAVYLQHPFWGDVLSFSRCEAAFFESDLELDQVGTPAQ